MTVSQSSRDSNRNFLSLYTKLLCHSWFNLLENKTDDFTHAVSDYCVTRDNVHRLCCYGNNFLWQTVYPCRQTNWMPEPLYISASECFTAMESSLSITWTYQCCWDQASRNDTVSRRCFQMFPPEHGVCERTNPPFFQSRRLIKTSISRHREAAVKRDNGADRHLQARTSETWALSLRLSVLSFYQNPSKSVWWTFSQSESQPWRCRPIMSCLTYCGVNGDKVVSAHRYGANPNLIQPSPCGRLRWLLDQTLLWDDIIRLGNSNLSALTRQVAQLLVWVPPDVNRRTDFTQIITDAALQAIK